MKFTSITFAAFIATTSAFPLQPRQQAPASVSGALSSIAAAASSAITGSSSRRPSSAGSSSRRASSSASASASAASSSSSSSAQIATAPLNTTGATDVDILQAALALEHLEISFYRIGLNFDENDYESAGFDRFVRQRFTEIISQEQNHIDVISSTITELGGTPNGYCNYAFPNVTNVGSFLRTAQEINDVGPGAYIGASGLIQNGTLRITSSQILSNEARHNAWVRSDVNKGDAFPQTYQTALTLGQAYTLASQFIESCPTNSTPLITTAKPSLILSPLPPYQVGDSITLKQGATFGPPNGVGNATATPAMNSTTETIQGQGLFAIFILGDSPQSYKSVPLGSGGSVEIPEGVSGQSYVLVSSSATEVTDEGTIAGPAIVEVPVPARTFESAQGNPEDRVTANDNGNGSGTGSN